MNRGFTFVEVVVGVSISLVVAIGVYEGYRAIYSSIASAHLKVVVASLANEQFEIARNLPYSSLSSLPANQTFTRDGITFGVTTTVQNVDDPFDNLAPTDTNPADYKLVEVSISCASCKNFAPVSVTGRIAPKDLEP